MRVRRQEKQRRGRTASSVWGRKGNREGGCAADRKDRAVSGKVRAVCGAGMVRRAVRVGKGGRAGLRVSGPGGGRPSEAGLRSRAGPAGLCLLAGRGGRAGLVRDEVSGWFGLGS